MGNIPKELIDDIRAKSDIVETVSSYIPLNKKGKNFVGLCPFHEDSNPSMSVNPERQIFKCFVCGEGGNVFTFIEKYEKSNFVSAVIKQARNLNIDMSRYETTSIKPVNKHKEKLFALMKDVQNFTSYQLKSKDGAAALEVLRQRGYPDEIIEKFGIGVALSGNQILKFLKAKGYTEEEMLSADIIRIGAQDLQDVFYQRIMFPINDQYGNTIAFSARALDQNSKVKYINTGESELYTKGNNIYNLDRVKKEFRNAETMIITEGVTDVFAFSMAGYDNAVSLLGVACSETQLQLIKRNTKSVLLAFDADKAGYDATFALGLKLSRMHIPLKIWYNDSSLDPDDLYKQKGKEAISKGIEEALGWFDFLLTYGIGLYGIDAFDDKRRLISFYLPHLENQDTLTQDFYLGQLSKVSGFDVLTLKAQLRNTNAPIENYETQTAPVVENYNDALYTQNIPRAELEILNQMILSKEATQIFSKSLGFLPNELAQETALLIQNVYRTQDHLDLADVLSNELSDKMRKFILELEDRLTFYAYEKEIVEENIEAIKQKMYSNNSSSMLNKLKLAQGKEEQSKLLDAILKRKNIRR